MLADFKKFEYTLPYRWIFLPRFPNSLLFQQTKRIDSAAMLRTGSNVLEKIESGSMWTLLISDTSKSLPVLQSCYLIAYERKLKKERKLI